MMERYPLIDPRGRPYGVKVTVAVFRERYEQRGFTLLGGPAQNEPEWAQGKNVVALKEMAREAGVTGYSSMKRGQLIAVLSDVERVEDAEQEPVDESAGNENGDDA